MDDVNLYIEVSTEQVRKCRRRYLYMLEHPQGRDAAAWTEAYTGVGEDVSLERAVLTAVARGLGRVKDPSEIKIYMGCRDILAPLKNGTYSQWEKKNFKNAKGEGIKNIDLWVQVKALLETHLWHGEGHAEHPYRKRMLYDMKKMEEKNGRKTREGTVKAEGTA